MSGRSSTAFVAALALALPILLLGTRTATAQSIDGVIYDVGSGAPIASATVELRFDAEDAQSPDSPVPASNLGANQQGQTTDSSGRYRFDISGVGDNRSFRIAVGVGATSHAFPSARAPAQVGFAPAGAVVPNPLPASVSSASRPYYLRFAAPDNLYAVTNNHIPLDPLPLAVRLTQTASRARAEVGDIVTFRFTGENASRRDLTEASGSRLFLRFAPARGLDVVGGSAAARITCGGASSTRTLASTGVTAGNRLVRLGPIDLVAGARFEIELRAVVGVDTRPGKTVSRGALLGDGGVLVSAEAEAEVEIDGGRGIASSFVLGRVFCDENGDGALSRGERGVFGARIYIDTGSFAVSDGDGLFHFTRVAAGVRLIKIDAASLASSTLLGGATRLLRIEQGLSDKVSFPVDCRVERITTAGGQLLLSHLTRPTISSVVPDQLSSRRMVIGGDLLLLAVKLDENELELPSASARLEAPATLSHPSTTGTNLVRVPGGGYGVERPRFVLGFEPPAGVASSRWTFVITPMSGGQRGSPIFQLSGPGKPPAAIDWDGRASDGGLAAPDQLYAAQLVVIGSGAKTEAASALVPFGIAFGLAAVGPASVTWSGALFGGTQKTPTSTPALLVRVERLVKTLGPDDSVLIEAHTGAGNRIAALAATQRRAELVKSLLVGRAIAADKIDARGRGAMEPLAPGATAAQNERVEIAITRGSSGNSGGAVPSALSTAMSALIDGQPVEVSDGGRFRWEGAVPTRGAVLIDVQARDGRRAAIELSLGRSSQLPNRRRREVELAGQLDAPSVSVGGSGLDARLLALDVRLVDAGGAETRVIRTESDGSLPAVRLQPVFDADFVVRRADIILTDGSGKEIDRLDALADRAGVRWTIPLAARAPRASFAAQLVIELEDGTRAYSGRRDFGIDVAPTPAPPRSAQLLVNGVAWPVVDGAISGTARVPEGGALLVDVTRPSGQRALYVVVLGGGDAIGAFSPQAPPPILGTAVGRSRRAVSSEELRASAAADFWIELPPAGHELSRSDLAVRGHTRVGSVLTINGVSVAVSPDGGFATVIALQPGRSELRIENRDAAGFIASLRWPVVVRDRQLFYMALGEVAASTSMTSRGLFADTAYIAGMTPESTAAVGPLLLSGRLSLYLKGELSAGRAFSRVRFTAHVDTARRRKGAAFFEDVLDPGRDEPTLGDEGIEVRDANGRGKLYLRVEADESEAIVGALVAEVGSGQLFRYGRTVDGAAIMIHESTGAHRLDVDAFGTAARIESSRDHIWYRSTGGSLYYLRFAQLIEGSELIRVVVRDRDSGMVAREKVLRRNTDYTIDYQSGRFWLLDPVPTAESSQWVLGNLDSSMTPDSGNPVYLDARYEHRDASGLGARAGGFEAAYTIGDRLQLGVGAAGEGRDGVSDYSIVGANASYRASGRSRVEAEIASSRRREGSTLISTDGGLSFRDLAATATLENPTGEPEVAWRVGASVAGGDLAGGLEGSQLRIYGQGIDRGFSASGTELERGRLKLGVVALTPIGSSDQLILRHQTEVSELPRLGPGGNDVAGELDVDPLTLDERSTSLTSLGWTTRSGRVVLQVEAAHQRITSTAERADGGSSLDARRVGIGTRAVLALTADVKLEAFQEAWVATRQKDSVLNPIDPLEPGFRNDDPLAGITTGVGLEWKLIEDATILSELRQRWNGDQAASIGVRARLSELGSFYVAERAVRTDTGPRAVTVIGAEDRFGTDRWGSARSYGEYQVESDGGSHRNRAVLGLGRTLKLTRELGLGLGFEHQQVFGGFLPDGTAAGNNQRDLIRATLDYALGARLRAGVVGELRADRGLRGGDVDQALVDSDPRDVAPGGFSDHGGVAPGAPLVLPAGETTQLVGSGGFVWHPEPGLTAFVRARGSRTFRRGSTEAGPTRFGFGEVTTGLAYRSILSDRLALVLRYSYLTERRPDELARDTLETAHVLAAVPIADLSDRFRLSAKLAWKRSIASGGLAPGAAVNAMLGLLRLGLRIHGNWDTTLEGRALRLSGSDSELLVGSLVEIGYSFDKFFRFGVGYNLSHFNDDELGDLTRDAHGVFVRLTAEL